MSRLARSAWALAVLLASLLCAACGKRGPTADSIPATFRSVPEATDGNGWPLYEVKAEGFALALPPGWRQIDVDPATFDAKFADVVAKSPELESLLGNLRQQITAGVRFFGVEEATAATGFATNANVLLVPLPPGVTLDEAAADTVLKMEALSSVAKPVTRKRVAGAEGDRERLHIRMTMPTPDGKHVKIASTQYLAARGGVVYVLTLTTGQDQEAKYAPTFDKIGMSFRFTK